MKGEGAVGSGCLAPYHRDKATMEIGNGTVDQEAADEDSTMTMKEVNVSCRRLRSIHRRLQIPDPSEPARCSGSLIWEVVDW